MAAAQQALVQPSLRLQPLDEVERICRDLAGSSPEDTQKIAAELLTISKQYYMDVRGQAKNSFKAALVSAYAGMALFSVSVGLVMQGHTDKATLMVIASVIPDVISGVIFYLYFRTMRHFSYFHVCLERMNRFLISNSVSANISCSAKRDQTRTQLVETMAQAPMLPVEGFTAIRSRPAASRRTTKAKAANAEPAA